MDLSSFLPTRFLTSRLLRLALVGCALFATAALASGATAAQSTVRPIPPDEPLSADELAGFRARLLSTTTRHLDRLLTPEGKVVALKGKSADGMTALSFQLVHEINGDPRYRAAAVELAQRILEAMRATKHGVLFIKEKEAGEGDSIEGGGPPAFGWYVSAAAYVFRHDSARREDLRYLASVADRFPWHEGGWWANTIDVETGRPKEPLIKAGAINKNAGMALAAAVVAASIRDVDDALAARLNAKAELCVHRQILPKQQPDGFWHYGLSGNDPKGKDILGYFMVSTDALLKLRHFAPIARETELDAALTRAFAFARREIAPMTAPSSGPASSRTTRGTPSHFALADNPKRGFTLGLILVAGGYHREAMKIINHWTQKFPVGDRGQDGAKSADSFAHMLALLAAPASPLPAAR